MSKHPSRFSKIFGSGPAGLLISLALLFIAYRVNERLDPPQLLQSQLLRISVLLVSGVVTIGLIIWSVKSLPASERGNRLSTAGPFRYVRHPLYAAFLSVFTFGLAVYLNSYVFILWALLLHPVWHCVIRYEERLMVEIFGQSYVEYQGRTGRFFPRMGRRQDEARSAT